jgi:hypothetical protein
VQIAPSANAVAVAVVDVDIDVVLLEEMVGDAVSDEDERTPSQDPEIQVLNAQSRSEEQVAPVLPQRVWSMVFDA